MLYDRRLAMPPHDDRTVTRPRASEGASDPDARPWLFLVACGQTPSAAPTRYALDDVTRVTLGRGDEGHTHTNDALHVRSPDPWMSSTHATLERVVGAWLLNDASSKNGTRINGAPARRAKLNDGDVIEVGSTFFVFRALRPAPGADGPRAWRPVDDADTPLATLLPSLAADMSRLRAVARTRVPVLLCGESGSGRAALVGALHALSQRAGAFVTVPCGALAPTRVQADLLGARRGAFPEADADREGLVARAHGGTLFLDELCDLSQTAQAALLRALREGDVLAVGADHPVRVDVRAVAATRHDPDACVLDGTLRPELLASLAGFTLRVPPLRDRREDLGLLLRAVAARSGVTARFDAAALRAMLAYAWPHNLPELEQCVASALALSGGDVIALEHLPDAVRGATREAPAAQPRTAPPAAPDDGAPSLVLEGEYWTVSHRGAVVRLRDGDGVRYLAYLIERPGVEVHALELATFGRGARRGGPEATDAGDGDELSARGDDGAGPLIDAEARAAYKRRIEDLRGEIEEATGWGDRERAAKAQSELDALARELSRAVGLGGRERKAGSSAERARVAVTMRVRATLKKLAEANAALGEHLDACVRTGAFCSYSPRTGRAAPPAG